jgi:hypothetical protein
VVGQAPSLRIRGGCPAQLGRDLELALVPALDRGLDRSGFDEHGCAAYADDPTKGATAG